MDYRSIAKRSFITRINVFLFQKIIDGNLTIVGNKLSQQQEDDFLNFDLKNNRNWVEYYVTEYYQKGYEEVLEDKFGITNKNNLKVQDVYEKLEDSKIKLNVNSEDNLKSNHELYEKYVSKVFESLLPRKDFENYMLECKDEKNHCEYCGISLKEIRNFMNNNRVRNKRAGTRGYYLELDRKEPNFEYSKNNLALSCYWCNNAKTDEFGYEEFKEIAKKIKEVWDKRANSNGFLTSV